MENTDSFLGEKLSRIFIKRNTDFVSRGNFVLADEIDFVFENNFIRILPIIDTDELVTENFDFVDVKIFDDYDVILTEFTNKKLSGFWNCVNANG